jgi:HlyD family secretion protein
MRWSAWLRRGLWTGALLAAGLMLVRAWLPDPIPVDLASAERGALTVSIDEDARTRVKDRYLISAPLAARVERIELRPGDRVTAGQVLANLVPLEPPMLDARTREQASAQLAAAGAARQRAYVEVQRAGAAADFAQKELTRQHALQTGGAIAERAMEEAELQTRTATNALTSAQFAAKVSDHEFEMARVVALERGSERGAGRAQERFAIRAPLDGQVLKVLQESAGAVQPGAPLLEVGDLGALEIVADLLTSDAVHVAPGARAELERWGGERPLRAHVRSVEPSAFTRISALGVEEQRVHVLLELDSSRSEWAALGDGYLALVKITTWHADDVLSIPASAVFRHGERWASFQVIDGRAQLAPLELGAHNQDRVEVRRGLPAGAQVIVHPSDRVKADAAVQERR